MECPACEPARGFCWVALCPVILLPKERPPRTGKLRRKPVPVPYLKNPPAAVPIGVGRLPPRHRLQASERPDRISREHTR